ncbi:hypothetical protein Tco_0438678 [Tanacetum coccineum]
MDPRNCFCGEPAIIQTSWTQTNIGCRFYSFARTHVVAALWDGAGNKSDVDIPKLGPCFLLAFYMEKGRPPKKRKKSVDELSSQKMTSGGKLSRVGKTVTCDTFKKRVHNKRSCKDGVGGSQPSQAFATLRASQAFAARGSQDATTPRTSQRPAVTPRTSQRPAATPRLSQRPATTASAKATTRGKEKVV